MPEPNYDFIKLVCRRMYAAQKLRIQSDLRIQTLQREGKMGDVAVEEVFGNAKDLDAQVEKEYERILWREVKDMPIIQDWLQYVRGIGPRLGGLLVATLAPISRFETAGKLWAYSGYHVIDGEAPKRKKGEKANWNPWMRVCGYRIMEQFLKHGGPYRELYDTYRTYLIDRLTMKDGVTIWKTIPGKKKPVVLHLAQGLKEPPEKMRPNDKTLGHVHMMICRRTIKIFLSNLWEVWRKMEGLPCHEPYAIEKLGHQHVVDPWKMIDPPKKKGRRNTA